MFVDNDFDDDDVDDYVAAADDGGDAVVMVMAGDRRDPVPHVGRDADSEGSGDVRHDGGDL